MKSVSKSVSQSVRVAATGRRWLRMMRSSSCHVRTEQEVSQQDCPRLPAVTQHLESDRPQRKSMLLGPQILRSQTGDWKVAVRGS